MNTLFHEWMDWNHIIGPEVGPMVSDRFEELTRRKPEPQPKVKGLHRRVREIMAGVSRVPDGLEIGRSGLMTRGLARFEQGLPTSLRSVIVDATLEAFRHRFVASLWFELELVPEFARARAQVTTIQWERIGQGLELTFNSTPWMEFYDCFGQSLLARHLGRLVWKNLVGILRTWILTLMYPSARGEHVKQLLDLYLEGNYPLGRLRDGKVFVLTA